LVNRVSESIQDILDRTGPLAINIEQIEKAAAILFDDKYILAIATGDSTVNNTVLVFDFNVQAWTIINGWFPADWVEFDNRLFYADAVDGRVIEVFTGTTGDYLKGPNFINAASVPSVGIEYTVQTRVLDFDAAENFKQMDAIEFEFDPTGNYNATTYINLDNSGWQLLGTVNLAGTSLQLDFTLPGLLTDSGVSRKTFDTVQKGEFKKMQVMVQQGASSQSVALQRITVFGRRKPWTRTNNNDSNN